MQAKYDSLSTAGGLAAILLWSATFALARSLAEQIGPLTTAAAVYLLGGGAGLLRRRCCVRGAAPDSPSRPSPRYLFGCGGLFLLYTVAIYVAVGLAQNRAQVLEIALVNYLWPALTILLSLPLLRQRATLGLAPGTALALAGIFLVMTQGAQVSWAAVRAHLAGNPAAYLLALTAAVAWGFYSNLARRWAAPGSAGAVEWFMLATGAALLGVRLLVTEPARWSLGAAGEVAALAAITTVAYILWDRAMRRGNLLLVAVSSYFTPLLSTLVSCAYLQVLPGAQLWAGCALLIAGSLWSWAATRPSGGDD